MKKIQRDVDGWVSQYKVGYFKPHEILARLIEEVGEIAREINHRWGPKKKKKTEQKHELGDEIADAIFTLVCLANSQKIDLDNSWKRMMKKLQTRDEKRYQKKMSAI